MMGVDVGEYFLVVLTEAPGWEEQVSGSRNAGLREGSEQSRAIITDDIPPLFVLQRGVEAVGIQIVDQWLVGKKKKCFYGSGGKCLADINRTGSPSLMCQSLQLRAPSSSQHAKESRRTCLVTVHHELK
jgi:hypothetical protein